MSLERSFLGEASTRLGRALDLDGEIKPQLLDKPAIAPVIVLADGTSPGMSQRRGRRWSTGFTITGGGVSSAVAGILATADVVVSLAQCGINTASVVVRLVWHTAAETAVVTMNTAVPILDRASSINELAPVLSGSANANPGGTVREIGRQPVTGNGIFRYDQPFLLTEGSRMWFVTDNAGCVLSVTFAGWVF